MKAGMRGMFLLCLVLSTLTCGWTAAPASPVVHLQWSPDHPPTGTNVPGVVAYRGGYGLSFAGSSSTRLNLSTVANETDFGFNSAMSIAMVVRPTQFDGQSPLVSKYRLTSGGRCYELGFQSSGAIYWVVSPNGEFSGSAKQLDTAFQVAAGTDYFLAVAYQPSERMSIYVNGGLVLTSTDSVPSQIHENTQIPMLGARSSADTFADATIGDVWFYDRALNSTEVAALAEAVGLTDAPPPDPVPFEEALYPPGHVLPPVRAITSGPKYHWFSYYDVLQFDPTSRFALGMEVGFEGRSPRADDVVTVGMIDLQASDRWIPFGTTTAWCWQQGCRLQWRPGSYSEVIWNDRSPDGTHYIARVRNVWTGEERTLPRPVYHISPDGKTALGTDFRRIGWARAGYGYNGIADPNRDVHAPESYGVYSMDLDTGESTDLFTIADVLDVPYLGQDSSDWHYVNHIKWDRDGARFLFLDRGSGHPGRMLTAARDGSDMRMVCSNPSHYDWQDAEHIIVYTGDSFRLFKDDGSLRYDVMWKAPNGHETYFRDNEWILSDTYPLAGRLQHPYLFHVPTKRIIPLGHFQSPSGYDGEWRCDTHPRISPDGTKVIIDSPHNGGRQMYLIDIEKYVGPPRAMKLGARDVMWMAMDWHKTSGYVPFSDRNGDQVVDADDILDLVATR